MDPRPPCIDQARGGGYGLINGLSRFVAAENIERETHCIVISGREGSYKFNSEILPSQWCPSEEIASEI